MSSIPKTFQIPPHDPDRKYFLLRLRAETFTFELEKERKLRSLGRGSMPKEWDAYLEDQCRVILDEVDQYERSVRGENSETFSSSPGFSETATHSGLHPSPIAQSTTTYPYRISPAYTRGCHWHLCSACNREREEYANYLGAHTETTPSSSRYPTATVNPERTVPQGHPPHFATTSPPVARHHLPDMLNSNATLDHPSPVTRALPVDRRGTGVKEYFSAAPGMLNGSQSTTIVGGVFYAVQGNITISANPSQ